MQLRITVSLVIILLSLALQVHLGMANDVNLETSSALNDLGISRSRKGDLDRAIKNFTKAIEFNPNNGEAYNNRGITLIRKKDFKGAIADFTKAIGIDPKNDQFYFNRANARKWSQDDNGSRPPG